MLPSRTRTIDSQEENVSLGDFISKQFIRVIQWNETKDGVLACRYPMQDMEIENGGQLTVRETQMAAFINEGQDRRCVWPGTAHAYRRATCRS